MLKNAITVGGVIGLLFLGGLPVLSQFKDNQTQSIDQGLVQPSDSLPLSTSWEPVSVTKGEFCSCESGSSCCEFGECNESCSCEPEQSELEPEADFQQTDNSYVEVKCPGGSCGQQPRQRSKRMRRGKSCQKGGMGQGMGGRMSRGMGQPPRRSRQPMQGGSCGPSGCR